MDWEEEWNANISSTSIWTILALQLPALLIENLLLLLQSCFSDRKKASNLEAYVDWFNRLSYLVATEICLVSNKSLFC